MVTPALQVVGFLSKLFGNIADKKKQEADQYQSAIDNIVHLKSVSEASDVVNNLMSQKDYLSDPNGLDELQKDAAGFAESSDYSKSQNLDREQIYQQMAISKYTQAKNQRDANNIAVKKMYLKNAADNLSELVKNGDAELPDAVNTLDKFFLKSKYATDGFPKNLYDDYTKDLKSNLIYQSILNAPIEDRQGMLKKYESSLSPLQMNDIRTRTNNENNIAENTNNAFLAKLAGGEFQNQAQAARYIASNKLPDSFYKAYNYLNTIKSMGAAQLKNYNPPNAIAGQLVNLWQKQLVKNVHSDPVDWAARNNVVRGIEPLDFSSPDIDLQVSKREAQIHELETKFHINIDNPFTKQDVVNLHNAFQNQSSSQLLNIVSHLPKAATDSTVLDNALFPGATWLVSQMDNGHSKLSAQFMQQVSMAKSLANSSDMRKAVQNVTISKSIENNIHNAFFEKPELGESLIQLIKRDAAFHNKSDVGASWFRGADIPVLKGKFVKNAKNLSPTQNVVYVSDADQENIVSKGVGSVLNKGVYYTKNAHYPINIENIRKYGQFVNVGINKLGIKITNAQGQTAMVADKNGKIITV